MNDRRGLLKKIVSLGMMGSLGSLGSSSALGNGVEENESLATPFTSFDRQHKKYESMRKSLVPYNTATPERYPELIIRANSVDEIIHAVKYAKANGLRVGVRSSGHNTSCAALRDGGVIIDLGNLYDLSINAEERAASFEPGVISAHLLTEALKHDLAFPVANCPSVAMGGYLLGGGLGFNKAQFGGVACYAIRSADVVLADGTYLTVSKDHYPELFWAVRGAGTEFFGIVTRINVDLFSKPKNIYRSSYFLPIEEVETVVSELDRLDGGMDPRLSNTIILMDRPFSNASKSNPSGKVCLVSSIAFADSDNEAKALLAPFQESRLAKQSMYMSEISKATLMELYPPMQPPGRLLGDGIWSNTSGALVRLAEQFMSVPSKRSQVICSYGVRPPAPREDACFSSIDDFYLAIHMGWDSKEDDERNLEWLKETIRLLQPYTAGNYINDVDGSLFPDRIRNSFSNANWNRLHQLRKQFDPDRRFYGYLGERQGTSDITPT